MRIKKGDKVLVTKILGIISSDLNPRLFKALMTFSVFSRIACICSMEN